MSQLPPCAISWVREKTATRTSVLWRGAGGKHPPLPKPEGPGESLGGLGSPSVLDISLLILISTKRVLETFTHTALAKTLHVQHCEFYYWSASNNSKTFIV